MEFSEFEVLLRSISSFLNLSSSRHIDLEPFEKYYKRVEELLKPISDVVVNSDLVSDEKLGKAFEELTQDIDQSIDLFRSWQAFSSKVCFVLQIESLIPKMRHTIVDAFQFLISSKNHLHDELSLASLEQCVEKIKHLSFEEISCVIDGALRDQREGVGPSPEILVKIGENTGLRSNQEILIEAVALERQKEIAEQSENNAEVEFLDQLIVIVNRMHGSVDNGQSENHHHRFPSAASTVSNEELPRADANENSEDSAHATLYSSDASGETKSRPNAATTSAGPRSDFSPKVMGTRSRGQFWRRPSDRLGSRIVSVPLNETRHDLSEVESQVKKLVEELKSSLLDIQRQAALELRLLAKHNMDNRIVIGNSGAIALLVELLHSNDSATQENAVTALLNLSINDNNKSAIADAGAIEPLIYVLENGSSEAKENSAATLFSLSVIEENKIKIGQSGAIKPLVDLLGNGTPRGKKDAATALFNLSIHPENKATVVKCGAVRYLIDLMDPTGGMVDKAVAVLANLATIPEGRNTIGQEGGIPLLVEVVELGSARGKENAAAALLQISTNSGRFCNMVLQEGAVPPLVTLSQSGTPRAREKAQALLSYFRNQRHGNTGRG